MTAPSRGLARTRFGGRRPIRACGGSPQNAVGLNVSIEDVSNRVAALALQGPTSAALSISCGGGYPDAQILPNDARNDCGRSGRYFANGLHRRSWLRDLDAVGPGDRGLGPMMAAGRRSTFGPRACWPWMSRASKRACSDRRGLSREPEGVDGDADIFALRNEPRSPRQARQASVRGARCARRRAPSRTGQTDRWAGGRLAVSRTVYEELGMPPQIAAAASRVAVPVYHARAADWEGDDDNVVACAEAIHWPGDGRRAAFCGRTRHSISKSP